MARQVWSTVASGAKAREIIAELYAEKDGFKPVHHTFKHHGLTVNVMVRRAWRWRNSGEIVNCRFTQPIHRELSGGLVLSALAEGCHERKQARLKPGWSTEAAERRLSQLIADACAKGLERRRQDQFRAWFESQAIPQETCEAWVAEAEKVERPICYEFMTEADCDYWREKVRAFKAEREG